MLIVENYLSYRICADISRYGVFHAYDISLNRCANIALFKRKVTSFGLAVLKNKSLAVAKRLSSRYLTAHKPQIFRIPTEVFACDHAVIYRDVFRVPECVLGF